MPELPKIVSLWLNDRKSYPYVLMAKNSILMAEWPKLKNP